MRTEDIYWLAGLIEGEGSFTITHTGPGGSPAIHLSMGDRDIVERAHRLLKFTSKISVRERANKLATKPHYYIQTNGRLAVGWMMTLYPLLGSRRQARIEQILTWWKSRRANPNWRRA